MDRRIQPTVSGAGVLNEGSARGISQLRHAGIENVRTGRVADKTCFFLTPVPELGEGNLCLGPPAEAGFRFFAASEQRMSAIEILSAMIPGLPLEAVTDPEHPGQLLLHTWDGERASTVAEVEHGGVSYIPKTLGNSLARWVRFPPPSQEYDSTEAIVSSLRDFLSTYAHLRPEVLDLLVAFVMATWFCDCMPMAPVLYLFGPDSAVSQILRLLGCCCRRAILLGDVDFASLSTLPQGLGATLLINRRDLAARLRRILLASNRRHFYTLRGKGRLDLYGAKTFACDDFPFDQHGLRASVTPAQNPLRSLSDTEEQDIASRLQATLLRWRLTLREQVSNRTIECREFNPEMREEASAWLAPILDCPELSNSVRQEILRQSQEAAEDRFFDPKCVVIEVALFFCHRPDTAHFLVGELAENVNALLKGRHEESELSAKRVGSVLRQLGIRGKRVAEGFKILLTDTIRKRIHELAYAYRVLSIADGVQRCPLCREPTASRSFSGDVHVNE